MPLKNIQTEACKHEKKKMIIFYIDKNNFQVKVFKYTTRLGPCVNQFLCFRSHTQGDIYPFSFYMHTKL